MKTQKIIVFRALLLLLVVSFLLGVTPLLAQMDTGSILGTVTDQSGGVITGAKVTLTNEGTGISITTVTASDGIYKFSPVKVGSYKIEVANQGFQTTTTSGVSVDIGANVVQNFT